MTPRCPGQDMRFWRPEDVSEKECRSCGYYIEFMKFDLVRDCPECGRTTVSPQFNLECAEWCEHARECLGQSGAIQSGIRTIKSSARDKLKEVLEDEPELRDHCLEVAEIAEEVGREEKVNLLTLILAALLHGPAVEADIVGETGAEEILRGLEIPANIQEEVQDILRMIGGQDERSPYLQILRDAHLLATGAVEDNPEEALRTEGALRFLRKGC